MFFHLKPRNVIRIINLGQSSRFVPFALNSTLLSPELKQEIHCIIKLINDHPFPDLPLHPTLSNRLPSPKISNSLVENILGGLFAAHTNGLKAFEFFNFCIKFSNWQPTPAAFEMTLHILARMRYFDQAWLLMEEFSKRHPSLLTLKSISILLTKIAKFKSYEETLEAFEKMEKCVSGHRKFGTDEFNVLLRAFCAERQMKEAKSLFRKMHSRFPPDTKTMNILLVGFKETGDITAAELFYHEMLKRGFKPSVVTYGIRIDAYCKKGYFGDGLRLLKEMERAGLLPTLEIYTTLIHGAGVAQNKAKAWELFSELCARNLKPDAGAYCALITTLVRCRDVSAAVSVMDEMEKNNLFPTDMTYHMIFYGMMKTSGSKGVMEIFERMDKKNVVPQTRTVVMLMKFFCQNCEVDLGLKLWNYLVERGFCPHDHALALLVTCLCSQRRPQEAFVCCKQMLIRGRFVSDAVFNMLERHLLEAGENENLRVLDEMRKKLSTFVQNRREMPLTVLSLAGDNEFGRNQRLSFHSKMRLSSPAFAALLVVTFLAFTEKAVGLRFVIDREECFSHKVEYDWDTVHASFVVIKYDSSWQTEDGVDLVVTGPSGDQIQDFRYKISEKFEFVAHQKGVYKFCFTNRSPYHETIDFDAHVGHYHYYEQHAKDEHLKPVLEQIGKLEEALYNIQFEQHWLEAQTERQSMVNDAMSKRAIYKALFESAALISASVLQVYLLRRLFEKKLGTSRV
ncbi:hypothetical protein V2J09_001649 [Rumex salicifolius]